jgi:L-alanine-DL-glutamate epimerase-like enolase superfamily enzyme
MLCFDESRGPAMKISAIRSHLVALPAAEPLAGAAENPSGTRPIVTLEVDTDDGVTGIGVTYFGGALSRTLHHAVEELGALAHGEDPLRVEAVAAKLRAAAGSAGPGGIFHLALSAIDTALWDIRGKVLGQPLWKLLGGARERVPTYASGALMRGLTLDQVVKAAATLRDKGWREMKTQLALPGETTPAREVERVRRVREAIGPDIRLMCDINQRWRPEQAIDIGRRVEEAGVGLFWLEDVTAHDDYPGLARVTAALRTPVAGGEYVWGIVPFRHMMERHSVDIVMIDLVRVGGVTQWLKVAGMAEAFNLPVVSHLIPEVHVHLIGAVPNGLTVEYMPWLTRLFEEVPQMQNGELVMPQKPGLGLAFDREAIRRYGAAA